MAEKMITEYQAWEIATKYLLDHPLGHPDYIWVLKDGFEHSDAWLFPFHIQCKKDIPPEKQEKFAGAPAFQVTKENGAVKVLSWAEFTKQTK